MICKNYQKIKNCRSKSFTSIIKNGSAHKKFTPIFQKIFTIKILKKSHKIIKGPPTIKSPNLKSHHNTPLFRFKVKDKASCPFYKKSNPHSHKNTTAISHQYQRFLISPLKHPHPFFTTISTCM